MASRSDSFRMNPITLFALIGGVVAFVVVGAIVDVLWVVLGAAVGAAIGWAIRRFASGARVYAQATDLTENATKSELLEEAARLDVPARTTMTKDELAQAISERKAS